MSGVANSLGGAFHCNFLHSPARRQTLHDPPLPRKSLSCRQVSVTFMKMESAVEPIKTRIWLASRQRPLRSSNYVFRRSIPAPIPAPECKRFFQLVPQKPSPNGKTRGPEIFHARAELRDKMPSSSAARSGKFKGLMGEGGPADERHLCRLHAQKSPLLTSAFLLRLPSNPFCRTLVPRARPSASYQI